MLATTFPEATVQYRIPAKELNSDATTVAPTPRPLPRKAHIQGSFVNRTAPIGILDKWQRDAIKEIISIGNLPAGWDGGSGASLSESIRDMAMDFIGDARIGGLSLPRFSPLSGGGLEIDWWSGLRREIEFHFEPNLGVSYLKVEDGKPLSEGSVVESGNDTFEQLLNWLRRG